MVPEQYDLMGEQMTDFAERLKEAINNAFEKATESMLRSFDEFSWEHQTTTTKKRDAEVDVRKICSDCAINSEFDKEEMIDVEAVCQLGYAGKVFDGSPERVLEEDTYDFVKNVETRKGEMIGARDNRPGMAPLQWNTPTGIHPEIPSHINSHFNCYDKSGKGTDVGGYGEVGTNVWGSYKDGGSGGGPGQGRVRTLDIPRFDGKDPNGWVMSVERIGYVYRVSEDELLEAVEMAFVGDVLQWYQWENKRRPFRCWSDLKMVILRQYSPSTYQNFNGSYGGYGGYVGKSEFRVGETAAAENYAPGLQSYYESGAVLSLGTEGGDNPSPLVKRMSFERQSFLPNPNPFWPGRDALSVGPKSEYLHEFSQQSNIPSSITDNPRSQLQPQNVPPQAAYQLRLQSPNQPSLTSLLGQGAETISGMLNRENLLSSGLSQDPELLILLQHQYLMQLQSQSPAPSQQLYVLDKLRPLQQQQQKQEEQRFEISSSDVASMVKEFAPEFCSVYVVANDKLQSVRPATLNAENLSNPETMLPDVSVENSKQDKYVSCQSLHDDKDFQEPSGSVVVAQNVSSKTSSEIDKDETRPFSPKDPDVELKRLKHELKQTIGMYKSACREAARAKKMLKEIQQWKQKEAPKYEQACLAHEAALVLAKVEKVKCRAANEAAEKAKRLADMEAQRRLYAELKVGKDVVKKRVLNVLSKNDVRYRKYTLEEIEAATNKLSESYDPVYGARPIRRWLERKWVTELSRMLVRAEIDEVPENMFRKLFFVSLLLFAGSVATINNPNGGHHKDGNKGGNRNDIRSHVGDIDVAAVPCGFGYTIGNKGAVGLRMRVYDRILCFENCHFAAHLEAVNRRNADFDHVYRTMFFSRPSNLLIYASAGVSSSIQVLRGANVKGIQPVVGMPDNSEVDMVVFLGDFNYRLDGISYDEARDFISQRSFDWLRERDQLQAKMKCGNVFQGMREALISFPPTYKFEHQPGLAGYDYGEKKRIPAWSDRILYRDSCSTTISTCSLDCPIIASVLQYGACMDVTYSDHKPVRCLFDVEVARVDNSIRRQQFGEMKDRIIDATRTAVEEGIVPGGGVALLHARRMASGWYFSARTLIFYPGGWTNEELREKLMRLKTMYGSGIKALDDIAGDLDENFKSTVGHVPISPNIPEQLSPELEMEMPGEPEVLLDVRQVQMGSERRLEVVLKWKNLPLFEATWEDVESTHARFSLFHLEDKVNLWGRGIAMNQPGPLITYARCKRGGKEVLTEKSQG